MGTRTFDYTDPQQTGVDTPTKGAIEARLAQREIVDGRIRTIDRFIIPLVDGVATAVLSDTDVNQCWILRELAPIAGRKTMYKDIQGDGPITDAPDVDPSTFTPLVPFPPSAQEVLAQAGEARDEAVVAADLSSQFADDAADEADAAGGFADAAGQALADLLAQKGAEFGLPTLDGDKKILEEFIPERLEEESLNATIATGVDEIVFRRDGLISQADLHPSQKLLPFYAALADRENNPCDILWLGDSITEGQSATAVSKRWVDVLLSRLRAAFPVAGVTGGSGYVPAWYAFPLTGQAFTNTGVSPQDTSRGLGRRSTNLGRAAGVGGTMTITRRCTAFDLFTSRSGSGVSIVVDGGAPVNSATGSGLTVQATRVSGLSDADHTIVITKTGADGNNTYVHGAMFYNGDETKGIRFWEGAKSGTRAEQFAAANGAAGSDAWADMLGAAVTPDLAVISWITNDLTTVTAAAFKTHVTNVITLIRSKVANCPILLLPMWERNTGSAVEPWANYLVALQEIAAATTWCGYVDLGERIPKIVTDTAGILADGTHPNDKGYSLIADVLLGALRPR